MLKEKLGRELLFFDGGMGTLLQKKGLLGEYIFAGYESLLDIYPDTEDSVA